MSTKATLQALISTNLADGSLITASEHRAVEDALLNELYPSFVNETHLTTNTVTSRNTSITTNEYNISICKQGRLVTINGKVLNNSADSRLTQWFFEITNSEYFPATNQFNQRVLTFSQTEDLLISSFGYIDFSSKRFFIHNIGENTEMYFQITYFTQS